MEIIKEYFKKIKEYLEKKSINIFENLEKIKILLEILAILVPILTTIFIVKDKINFEIYYMIPARFGMINSFEILKKITGISIVLIIYIWVFFDKTKKETRFLSIPFGMIIGILYYSMFAQYLTYYAGEKIQKIALNYSETFYFKLFLIFILLNIFSFIAFKLDNEDGKFDKIRKVLKSLGIIIAVIFIFYVLKDVLNIYPWKRKYEVFKDREQVKVILSEYNGKFVVTDGKIETETLTIKGGSYELVDMENKKIDFIIFRNINVKTELEDKNNNIKRTCQHKKSCLH
ncbi:MAG: hypothetical protein ACLVH9_06850 [Fusobacterium sp.]|uniref:hypothetical protein n=1 Tax=Fusobacterium sp. TaxID=68766 RepID=UPI0025D640F2|nr:hypothetical protein [uncultured Fusobacterium sp.]